MLPQHLTLIQTCIANNNLLPFYKQTAWKKKRQEVLALAHNECRHCKARGQHTRARYVHHVNHVKDRPELALSVWYTDDAGKGADDECRQSRNLISLCHACHERAHEHRVKEVKPAPWPERW